MLKTLLRVRLDATLRFLTQGKGSAKSSRSREIAMIGVWAYLVFTFISLSFSTAFSLGAACVRWGLDWLLFAFFTLATGSVLFFLGILEAKSVLFDSKDNDLLFPLPIEPSTIFLSRVLVLLLFHYVEAAIILVPALVAYLSVGGSLTATIGFLLVLLLLPPLATALAALTGFVWAYLSRRIPANPFVSVAVCIALLGAYFVGYSRLFTGLEQLILDVEGAPALVEARFAWLRCVGGVISLSPVPTVIFLGVCLLLPLGVYRLFSKRYPALATMTSRVRRHSQTTCVSVRTATPLMAVVHKEIARFTSSALYMLNAGLGLVFELVASVGMLVKADTLLITLSTMLGVDADGAAVLLLAALLALIPMTYPAAASVSLEGKSFWILRSLPLSDRDILLGKMLPQYLIGAPVHFIASVLLLILVRPSLGVGLLILLLPQAAALAFSAFGLFSNLLFPNLEFTHEAQVIKQSISAVVASLLPTVLLVGVASLLAVLCAKGLPMLALLLLSLLIIGLCALFFSLVFGVGRRLLSKIQ